MSTTLAATNLNRFVVFVAVVEMGSLTAAAARLGMAKTAVSAHMQRLEAEVGASLLIRTKSADSYDSKAFPDRGWRAVLRGVPEHRSRG